jgi:hypothetical protein
MAGERDSLGDIGAKGLWRYQIMLGATEGTFSLGCDLQVVLSVVVAGS